MPTSTRKQFSDIQRGLRGVLGFTIMFVAVVVVYFVLVEILLCF